MADRPDILILCEYAALNGGEQSMLATLPLVLAAGLSLEVAAPAQGPLAEELHRRGVLVVDFEQFDEAGRRLPLDERRRRLAALIEQRRPRLLHANSLSMSRLSGPVCDELGVISLGHLRDIIKLSKQALHDCGRHRLLLAVSQATADYHREQGLTDCPIRVLYNGVDLERFQPREPTGWLHRELGLPPSAMLIGMVGQLILRKGQDTLAEAAAYIASSDFAWFEPLPDLHYVFVGERASEKPETVLYEQRVHETFARAGLQHHAHFLGRRENLHLLLPELTMLVHPARQEPLGRVLLEAAAVGLPMIATDVGGTREILMRDGADSDSLVATMVQPNNPLELVDFIPILASSHPWRIDSGRAARELIEARFDIKASAAKLLEIYTELLDGGD